MDILTFCLKCLTKNTEYKKTAEAGLVLVFLILDIHLSFIKKSSLLSSKNYVFILLIINEVKYFQIKKISDNIIEIQF